VPAGLQPTHESQAIILCLGQLPELEHGIGADCHAIRLPLALFAVDDRDPGTGWGAALFARSLRVLGGPTCLGGIERSGRYSIAVGTAARPVRCLRVHFCQDTPPTYSLEPPRRDCSLAAHNYTGFDESCTHRTRSGCGPSRGLDPWPQGLTYHSASVGSATGREVHGEMAVDVEATAPWTD
jgi:hypothetical protein